MNVNDKQIGGTHYGSNYQHWDYVEKHNVGYLEACATKYSVRHRKKNGLQDLEKAKHYIEKLVVLDRKPRVKQHDAWDTQQFIKANQLEQAEASICYFLFKVWEKEDLLAALSLLNGLIYNYTPREDNTGMKNPFGYQDE